MVISLVGGRANVRVTKIPDGYQDSVPDRAIKQARKKTARRGDEGGGGGGGTDPPAFNERHFSSFSIQTV